MSRFDKRLYDDHLRLVELEFTKTTSVSSINTHRYQHQTSVVLIRSSFVPEVSQITMNSLVVLLSAVALAAAKPGLLGAGVVSYAAPAVATLPVAVSQQSRIDINSPPVAVRTVAAAAPLAIGAAPLATPLIRSSAIATPIVAPGILGTSALASPALVAPALASPGIALGAPLPATALTSAHLIRKRSAPLLTTPVLSAAPVVSTYSAAPVISSLPAASIVSTPIGLSSPLALSSPLITRAW
ncbi:cuticle protein 16.5-like [Galleria mellonella]|uniref:Cuticle protein 16.5-like n=1 Tax=Galleria mellonella TaxID=7137 RepID=A0A6J1X7S5_GALME|nr:cuticle protein 16.5-like [Galleria mellonella]